MIAVAAISALAISCVILLAVGSISGSHRLIWWKQTFSRDGCAYKDGEVYVYLAGTTTAARVFDINEVVHTTAPQVYANETGYIKFAIDPNDYSTGQLFDVSCYSGQCYAQDPIELKSLMILQDTEGGRNFKQLFVQDTYPDIEDNNVKVFDVWIYSANDNEWHVAEVVDDSIEWVSRRDGTIATAAGAANWSGVTDDGGKPENNADVTDDHAADIIRYQSSAPSHKAGRVWVDIDNGDIFRSNGSAWNQIGSLDALRLSNAPAESGAVKYLSSLTGYETGTYTVTCTPSTSGTVTLRSDLDVLRYQKIDDYCYVQGVFGVNSVSSPVGNARFSLPFAPASSPEGSASVPGAVATWKLDLDVGCVWMSAALSANNYFTLISSIDGAAVITYSASNLKADDQVLVSFSYKIA